MRAEAHPSTKIQFRDAATGSAIDLGEVMSVRAEVVNGKFNLAATFSSKVLLQINGLRCEGELRAGRHAGDEFRAVLMHTPWGDAALVGADGGNSLEVTHQGADLALITFSVVLEGHGRKISAVGSLTTRRSYHRSSVGPDVGD